MAKTKFWLKRRYGTGKRPCVEKARSHSVPQNIAQRVVHKEDVLMVSLHQWEDEWILLIVSTFSPLALPWVSAPVCLSFCSVLSLNIKRLQLVVWCTLLWSLASLVDAALSTMPGMERRTANVGQTLSPVPQGFLLLCYLSGYGRFSLSSPDWC